MPDLTVQQLWRFPVKSVGGQSCSALQLEPQGASFDRTYAVRDVETGVIASAKHAKRFGPLMECTATVDRQGLLITFPPGDAYPPSRDLDVALSSWLDRDVQLIERTADARTYARPAIDQANEVDAAAQAARFDRWATATGLPVPKTSHYVDLAHVHIVSQATLAAVQELGIDDPVARYRPNIVVSGSDPYAEHGWIGETFVIGDAQVQVIAATPRCVVPTLATASAPENPDALRVLNKANRVDVPGKGKKPCLGVYATITRPGTVAVDESVEIA